MTKTPQDSPGDAPSEHSMKKTFQIIFNDTSATELAALPKLLQLEILSQLETVPEQLEGADPEVFGRMEREGRSLHRFRVGDYRLYFERAIAEKGLIVHRILHKNTLGDFLFRTSLPTGAPTAEDEALQKNPDFWKMIDGRK